MAAIALVLLLLSSPALSLTAVDTAQTVSPSTLSCLTSSDFSAFIARLFYNGNIDNVGMSNAKAARDAGFSLVEGIFSPCPHSNCTAAANQMEALINRLQATATVIDRLWIDVDDTNYWKGDEMKNQRDLQSVISRALSLAQRVGIKSKRATYEAILGENCSSFRDENLWWTKEDGKDDFSGYGPDNFGGFSAPSIHRYSHEEKSSCGGIAVGISYYH